MIDPKQIPDAVVEALAASMNWRSAVVFERDRDLMRKHIAAALNAWPGMVGTWNTLDDKMWLTLPLPTENTNDA